MDKSIFSLIDRLAGARVLVIGEAMLDSYVRGSVSRISPEAPVPVVAVQSQEDLPGGAANVAVNVRCLGAQVSFVSVVGTDQEAEQLVSALDALGIETDTILRDHERRTLVKRRVMADGQVLVRFDQGSTEELSPQTEKRLLGMIELLLPDVDAIILSDYRYGILNDTVIAGLAGLQETYPHPIVVDSKRLRAFRGLSLSAVKPNYMETVDLLNLPVLEQSTARIEQIRMFGERILDALNTQIAAVTVDHDGALFFERGRPMYRTYAETIPHVGVSGAGDTFVAALTLALVANFPTAVAAEISSAAANIVVQKEGTSVCSAAELKAHFMGQDKRMDDAHAAAEQVALYRDQGKKIVFTNGVFDILHSGHVSYLNQAKELGDILVIGLNADESVHRLKGPDRPINHLDERARVLAAVGSVDLIVPFYEDTPVELIRQIRPDIYVKGGDYTIETLPEAPVVQSLGGEVRILPFVDGKSTSNVIDRIRRIFAEEGT